ncbi:MAG: hypothetical protein V3S29_06940 [bacterium]
MKRIPIQSIVLALAIVTGFFLLFPFEWVVLVLGLVGLITAQVVVVRRHLRPIGSGAKERAGSLPRPSAPRSESFSRAAVAAEEDAPAAGAGSPDLPFDQEVFSRFRTQLEAAEQKVPAQAREPAPAPQPEGRGVGGAGEPGDVVDRVELSGKARRRRAGAGKKAAPPTADEADLFEGLVPKPLEDAEKETGAKGKGKGKARAKPPSAAAEASGDEVAAAPNERQPAADSADQTNLLLTMAEGALEKGDRAGAEAGLQQVLAQLGDGPAPPRVTLARARLAVLDGDLGSAVAGFERILEARDGREFGDSDFIAQIDQLAAPLPAPESDRLRVSLLLKLLAAQRQAKDRPAMDHLYGLIQQAQEKTGDEEKLLQYYKNHLEIKKVLGDVEGQLELIDRIGNRYYKRGDTEAAQAFYEQGLKLRAEKATAQAADEGSNPPPSG